jgi:RimJ/RimL family protein N-acetyltransferase
MSFDFQPVLTGERLSMRPLRADDFDALFAAASDPLIWDQHPAKRYKPEVFGPFFQESLDSGGALVAIDSASGAVIGSSRYHGYEPERREIDIGWTFLAREYWGRGYNAEMKKLMLDHAFRFVDRVLFLVAPANFRSQRAVEKIGGTRIGMRTNAYGLQSVQFELTAAAYGARHARPV